MPPPPAPARASADSAPIAVRLVTCMTPPPRWGLHGSRTPRGGDPAVRGAPALRRLHAGHAEALRAQGWADDAVGEAPAVEVGLAGEALCARQLLRGLEQAQDRVGEAHVAHRAADPAVLDQVRPVAGRPGEQRLLGVDRIDVPDACHVEAALDRG